MRSPEADNATLKKILSMRSARDFVEPEPVARLVAVRARLVKVSSTSPCAIGRITGMFTFLDIF
jgi:hypothetical protein